MISTNFREKLLTLWSEANDSKTITNLPDFADWSGATKDLLLELGMVWDGNDYVFKDEP